jgi:ABC-2 type transport system permease protein
MRRINSISKRLGKELFQDKRTLAMIFLAPILLMWLMSVVFSTNTTTNVNVGVVRVNSHIRSELSQVKHVDVKKYASDQAAKKALKSEHLDAYVVQSGDDLDVTYANTNTSKTSLTKAGLQSSLTKETMQNLTQKLKTLSQQIVMTTHQAPQTTGKAQALKVHNHYVYGDSSTNYFSSLTPIMMAFFVFLFVFLISGMSLLKERTSGTLDRVLATPVKRSEIILGYLQTYGILSILQTIIIVVTTIGLLKIEILGNILNVIIVNVLVALVALAAGLLLSTLASSEFQMVQFIPIVVVPQIFLSGIVPLDALPQWLDKLSYIFPLRYAVDAQSSIIFHGHGLTYIWLDLLVLVLYAGCLVALNVLGLKRYRKV